MGLLEEVEIALVKCKERIEQLEAELKVLADQNFEMNKTIAELKQTNWKLEQKLAMKILKE